METVKDEKKTPEKPAQGREELVKAIEAEREERARACGKAIDEALKKFKCSIYAVPTMTLIPGPNGGYMPIWDSDYGINAE